MSGNEGGGSCREWEDGRRNIEGYIIMIVAGMGRRCACSVNTDIVRHLAPRSVGAR